MEEKTEYPEPISLEIRWENEKNYFRITKGNYVPVSSKAEGKGTLTEKELEELRKELDEIEKQQSPFDTRL